MSTYFIDNTVTLCIQGTHKSWGSGSQSFVALNTFHLMPKIIFLIIYNRKILNSKG